MLTCAESIGFVKCGTPKSNAVGDSITQGCVGDAVGITDILIIETVCNKTSQFKAGD